VIYGYLVVGTHLVAIGMNVWDEGNPVWWLFLEANPAAVVRLSNEERRPVHARRAVGEERDRLWQRWVETDSNLLAHAGSRSTETPVVVLEPLG
jgi:hypothetical protein